jgi:hypothetical protein
MGSGHSRTRHGATYADFTPVSVNRAHDDSFATLIPHSNSNLENVARGDCQGIWSLTIPTSSVIPIVRTGQCCAYDNRRDAVIIAYGSTRNGSCLNDCWAYIIASSSWNRFDRTLLSPRTQCSSLIVSRELFIFGGVCESQYFSDLHSVNLDTGQLTLYDSSSVSPRCHAHLFGSATSIFIFGGFDGRSIGAFDIFNLQTQEWTHIEHIDYGGRPGAVVTKGFDDRFYIFGDTTGHPLLRFDPATVTFEIMKCSGLAPPPDLKNSMIASFGCYLIIVGGERDSAFTYVYGLDIERENWFTLTVLPDGETVTLADGNIKSGMFQLPREHSSSFVYSPKWRAVVAVMGSRLMDPPPVHTIRLVEAIATLNVKSDMLKMLAH